MRLPFLRKTGSKPTVADRLRQLAILAGLALVFCYVAGVTAGYLWLTQVRKLGQVGVLDVALFRVQNVRHAMAAQQFTRAQAEWDAKNYQAAYVAFSTALRQDPDNVTGRLKAAGFFRAVGAANLGQILLEEGLARDPGEKRLIEATFDLLLGTGRDRHALDLLHKTYPAGFSGPNQLLLETDELLATLSVDGAAAAKKLLERYPDLATHAPAAPVVARVYWESAERLKAISLLASYLQSQPAVFVDYLRLASWQTAAGQPDAAIRTAEQACAKFPGDLQARVVLIEMQAAAAPDGRPAAKVIESYLRNYAARPEAIPLLAALAGSKGWVDLARGLYELGALRQANLDVLALYYSDALVRSARFAEVQLVLAQIEAQTPEASTAFQVQLRQRQIIAAAALGQSEQVRDFARRLGSTLGNDPDGLEICRRIFQKLNIGEAVAELTPRAAPAKAPVTTARK
jgi:hypothetical protein